MLNWRLFCKMLKKLVIIIGLCPFFSFAQKYGGKRSKDISASGGYTYVNINGNGYIGYNLFGKYFFRIRPNLSFGLGVKYISVSENETKQINSINVTLNNKFDSLLAGFDLAYKINTRSIIYQINPYVYYGLFNSWQQSNKFSNGATSITGSPKISTNILYGVGFSAFIRTKRFYTGPTFYYSYGYLATQSYSDSSGATHLSASGFYSAYDINLTFGFYL